MHALSKDPDGEQVLNSTAAATTTQTAVTKETGSREEANGSNRTVEQLLLKVKQLESEILLLKVDLLFNVANNIIIRFLL
jgi:hypothetical protein